MAVEAKDPSWLARVELMAQRGVQITEEMNRPEVATNGQLLVKLAKEHGELEKTLKHYRDYRMVASQIAETHEIIDDPNADTELTGLARAELPDLETRREKLLQTMKERLVTSSEDAITSVIVEIRAGTGGDEAALFVGDLLKMYEAWARRNKFGFEIMSMTPGDAGGVKELIANATGSGVYTRMRLESGGHRVQRVPETETQGRIHTSLATVAVLPEPEEIEVNINWDKDVLEHTSRAGGPGGQNVNKVESAIKLEHIATGITVSMREEKSQHKNRAKARRVLLSRVFEAQQRQQMQKIAADRKSMVGSGDRSDRIRTYNFPQSRITDHRIGVDAFNLEEVLAAGDLDIFHKVLIEKDIEQRLNNL